MMSVLQAMKGQESTNPLVNTILQTCQEIVPEGKYIILCYIPGHGDITEKQEPGCVAKDVLS